MKAPVFKGVATALITPFSDNGQDVDFKAFRQLCEFQTENSADALVVCGTTGESPVLSSEEKMKLFGISVEAAAGKIPVIAGTGSNNTEEAVRKSNDAEKMGVDSLLIVTPYYNKCTQEGLIKHYFYIADRVSKPIIVYNVPSRTGVTIKPETYLELSAHNNIAAVKEAASDVAATISAMNLCGNNLCFYSGNDDLMTALMLNGAQGVISVVSNIIPGIIHEITLACLNGEAEYASQLHKKYLKLMNAMFSDVNPIPVKYACSRLFGINNSLRLPMTKLSVEICKKTDDILNEYGLI